MLISLSSKGKVFDELSRIISTFASSEDFWFLPPLYIKFADFFALRLFADNLPRTKHMASVKFDFPLPLAPTTIDKSLSKINSVDLAKDLNPCIFKLFMCVILFFPISKAD